MQGMKKLKADLLAVGLCLLPAVVCVVGGSATGNTLLKCFGWVLCVFYGCALALAFIGGCWYWAMMIINRAWSPK